RRELLNAFSGRTDCENSEFSFKSLAESSDFDSAIRRFDPSRPSHAVRPSCRFPRGARKGRQRRAFAFGLRSRASRCAFLAGQIAESLLPFSKIFPFSGDRGRRLGSNATARGGRRLCQESICLFLARLTACPLYPRRSHASAFLIERKA